jgi:hypothetical protein
MAAQTDSNQLLTLLGEELKQPLVAIAQLAELQSSGDIKIQANKALRTIDNVLLHRSIASGQVALRLEPVHVGSAMESVRQTMQPFMKQQGCRTELRVQKSLQPVDVDKQLLTGVVESLWQAFASTLKGPADIVCRANKTSRGIRVSLSSASAELGDVHFARTNHTSSQPISAFAGPATDFLTAQQLCHLLGATLTKSANSIGVTLPPSRQLQIV